MKKKRKKSPLRGNRKGLLGKCLNFDHINLFWLKNFDPRADFRGNKVSRDIAEGKEARQRTLFDEFDSLRNTEKYRKRDMSKLSGFFPFIPCTQAHTRGIKTPQNYPDNPDIFGIEVNQ